MHTTHMIVALGFITIGVALILMGIQHERIERRLEALERDARDRGNTARRLSCEPLRYAPYEPDWRQW